MPSASSPGFGTGGDYAVSDAPANPPAKDREKRGRRSLQIGTSWEMFALLLLVIALIALSILLFRHDLFDDRDAQLLTLFSLAGALGGALRGFAYSLALGSFTPRERRQWQTEALVGPVIGAVAGLVAYLLVRASLVVDSAEINREGQYLFSLVAGAFALRPLGTIVERGVIRSSLSRSGILGGEVSPTVPILDRIERMLEQRVSEDTLTNYEGWVIVEAEFVSLRQWAIAVQFNTNKPAGGDDSGFSLGKLRVEGGEDRDVALFTVSVSSERYSASPLIMSASAPRRGESERVTIFVEDPEQELPPAAAQQHVAPPPERAVMLEVGQGNKTLLAVRVSLPG